MFSFAAAALALSQAAVPEGVPMSQEPYHRPVLKNDVVEVYDVVLPPKGMMRFHAHPTNHLAVVIQPGLMQNEGLGKEAKPNPSGPAGTVVYVAAGPPHRQSNVGPDTVRFIAVELAPSRSRPAEGPHSGYAHEERTETLNGSGCSSVVNKPDVRAWKCKLAPGQSVVQNRSAAFLRIPVTAGILRTGSMQEASPLVAGCVAWSSSAAGLRITNVGTTPAEFVDIEIK